MKVNKCKRLTLFDLLGCMGIVLWVLTIFLRETPVVHNHRVNLWLGVAPNFGVALLLPALIATYYHAAFKRALTRQRFLLGMTVIFTGLVLSEVAHDVFLNSRFDGWDLVASAVGLAIMVLVSSKTNEFNQANDPA